MKLKTLAEMASRLPAPSFDWTGPEQYHETVFASQVKTLEDAIRYIAALKDRMAAQSRAISELADAYTKLRDVVLEADISDGHR